MGGGGGRGGGSGPRLRNFSTIFFRMNPSLNFVIYFAHVNFAGQNFIVNQCKNILTDMNSEKENKNIFVHKIFPKALL